MKTKWLDNAQVKRELLDLLKTTPRKRWVESVMAKYGGTPEGRVAVFQVFCQMLDSGELDELKAREQVEVARVVAKTIPPPKLPTKRRMREVRRIIGGAAIALTFLAVAVSSASAGDHKAKRRSASAYALRRTEAGQVQGQPLIRRYSGGRTLDVYPNGLIYEGDNVVGVERRGK
jgi:hypothetical protein